MVLAADAFMGQRGLTEAEQWALEVLGSGKVLGCREVSRIWRTKLPQVLPTEPFSKEVVEKCATENNDHRSDWRLVYYSGMSLWQMRKPVGSGIRAQPSYRYSAVKRLKKDKDKFSAVTHQPGYRLLNFAYDESFVLKDWPVQSGQISHLGPNQGRADEQEVVEVCFSAYWLNAERLLPDWYHWGSIQTDEGFPGHMIVGSFDENGLWIGGQYDYHKGLHTGVILSRRLHPPRGG